MKHALISEEQIKQIEDVLKGVRSVMLGETPDGALMSTWNALAIIRSLKPGDPFSYYKTQKNMGVGAHESKSWYSHLPHEDDCDTSVPLFALEQA